MFFCFDQIEDGSADNNILNSNPRQKSFHHLNNVQVRFRKQEIQPANLFLMPNDEFVI